MLRKSTPGKGSKMMEENNSDDERVPLSVDQEATDDGDGVMPTKPLDERILALVAKNPSKVYPTRLVTELGLSHEDASAELCGLLSAVGSGASFHFESMPDTKDVVMCFSFPDNFQRRARRSRVKHEWRHRLWQALKVLVKVLKVVTAFGLILSLIIITIAGMIGLLAAVVAMSRDGNDHHRNQLLRRMRDVFFSMRQFLWFYAMFGQHVEGQDPFLSEIAYDISLATSVCCGNPSSLWFWWRADQLSRRRRYMGRSWGRLVQPQQEQDGVADRRERRWENDDDSNDTRRNEVTEHRGLLSMAIEFLFGPVPFTPGPSDADKWRLRAAIIMELSAKHGSVTLPKLSPYVDDPPASLVGDEIKLKAGGLAAVTHFHGMPKKIDKEEPEFIFPELLAESTHATNYYEQPDSDDGSFRALLHIPDIVVWSPPANLPSSLQERRYRLTMLGSKQFFSCVSVGLLNLIGVWWLAVSLSPKGILSEFVHSPGFVKTLRHTLIPVLQFYSLLFFALPAGRLVVIMAFNATREGRNCKRADLAHALATNKSSSPEDEKEQPVIEIEMEQQTSPPLIQASPGADI